MATTFIVSNNRATYLRPFYPALDGLRAIAFLLVFSFHLHPIDPIWDWGWVGVDIFFVLSGFLITGILVDSLQRPDYFRNFYIRRALRIFPLFYGFFLFLFLLTPLLHVEWNRYIFFMAAYIGNFFVPGGLLHLHPDPGTIFYHPVWNHRVKVLDIGHFWSLCVEEQFYFAWPAIIWMVRSRIKLLGLCLTFLVCLPLFRWIYLLIHPGMLPIGGLYFNTFAHMDGLLAGAALSLWIRGPVTISRPVHRAAITLALLPPAFLGAMVYFEQAPRAVPSLDPLVTVIGFSLIAVAAVGVVLLAIERETWFTSMLMFRPLVMMGRLTYGMYIFHHILSRSILDLNAKLAAHHLHVPMFILLLSATYALSWASFRFLEAPFLRLKTVLAPHPEAINDPPPDSGPLILDPEKVVPEHIG